MNSPGPQSAYRDRLAERRNALQAHQRRDGWVANARLGVALTVIPIAWGAWGAPHLSKLWLAVPAVVFAALVLIHERVLAAMARSRAAIRFYDLSLLRAGGQPVGPEGTRFAVAAHPYSADLDLFGSGSLFALLCTAQTQPGEETLAHWLLGPASVNEVRRRQEAVAELRPRVDLREDLSVLGGEVQRGLDPAELIRWAMAGRVLPDAAWLPLGLALLAAAAVGTGVGWLAGALRPTPFLGCVALVLLVLRRLSRSVSAVFSGVEQPARELTLLALLMGRFAGEPLESPKGAALRAAMTVGGLSAAEQVKRLARLLDLADARRNQLFAPFALVLLWSPQVALRLERWRAECGPHIAGWIASVGELEALSSLATYAFDHPEDPFPVLVEEGPLYEATGLAHPLLPTSSAVGNDVALGEPLRLVMISGSNMSGKSTFLRSVGVSAVMALAGGPVRAHALRLSPLTLGASLRAQDSLLAGTSRFYAEIQRLSQIVAAARGKPPLLFLLDEILGGTNSHDRREGAHAVLAALVDRGAMGLVTSHDLALAEIVPALGERAANMHFVDRLEGGTLVFDYRLRSGIVQKSNAVELMRAIGLPV